ncbi:hypothetical protein C2G38_2083023, partial [Gigaspora rosea]
MLHSFLVPPIGIPCNMLSSSLVLSSLVFSFHFWHCVFLSYLAVSNLVILVVHFFFVVNVTICLFFYC